MKPRTPRAQTARAATAGLLGLLLGPACPEPPSMGSPSTSAASSSLTDDPSLTDDSSSDLPREPAPLVDNTRWEPVEAALDPLPDHRPAQVECGPTGAFVEGNGLEIDTGSCNYLARSQPSLAEVRAGDRLAVFAFHDTLASVDPGEAHFALLLGDTVVWEERVPIPAAPDVVPATPFQAEVVVDVDAPLGTLVGLHLHNHGYNTWTLLGVEVRPGA